MRFPFTLPAAGITSVIQQAIMLTGLSITLPLSAAVQGEWGRTSSVTVKITLTISEDKPQNPTTAPLHYRSSDALQHYCQQNPLSAPAGSGLYQFSLADNTSVDQLKDVCANVTGTSLAAPQAGVTTILVAPL